MWNSRVQGRDARERKRKQEVEVEVNWVWRVVMHNPGRLAEGKSRPPGLH